VIVIKSPGADFASNPMRGKDENGGRILPRRDAQKSGAKYSGLADGINLTLQTVMKSQNHWHIVYFA
jgi:hypothetical protein